ncbi:Uma2 family endonuclease [Sphaerotilus microaerophilus]|nr:Uma2 family endonuclease [Sphaerotilus sp. FB-5]
MRRPHPPPRRHIAMSAVPQPRPAFDIPAYLDWEAAQADRHEYIAGEVFAMTGARGTHNLIAGNVYMALRQALRGTPCRTHIEGMKLHVQAADAVLYPDVFVTCDPQDLTEQAELAKTSPKLVVEVLSESTAAYDRGLKFELYQRLPSLQEYLLIEQDRVHADLFRRNAEGLWVLHPSGPGETVQLDSVGLTLPMELIYEDTAAGSAAAGA